METLRDVFCKDAPHVIVNAAAYTAVDKAESESDLAMIVNSHAVQVLAEEAKKFGVLLIRYSTDYVFDGGKPGPYDEDDAPNPLSVCVRTKLEGERAIQTVGCKHMIFRTSWVYAARGGNFAKTILRLAKERGDLNVVVDQVGAPTSAELIADVTALCVRSVTHCAERFAHIDGVYHVLASGETSWHGYAKFVVECVAQLELPLRLACDSIRAITTGEYPRPAKRPANSGLATAKLSRVFGIESPHWHVHLIRVLEELTGGEKA